EALQPAAAELQFPESAAGYALLRQRLERLAQRHGPAHFVVRLDAAGPYADNLLHFLHGLADANAVAPGAPAPFRLAVSCGDPQRNQNYRAALFGGRKSDPVEARAAARFALIEKPTTGIPLSQELRVLRQIAGRLQAGVRQRTRLLNQFHHLLALTFPELALLTKELAACWVLELVHRYPTARLLAAATPADDLRRFQTGEPVRARPAAAGRHGADEKRKDAKTKEKLAQQEANKATKARDFLASIFDLSELEKKQGTFSPFQLLDRAEQCIPIEFADHPELRADLMATL